MSKWSKEHDKAKKELPQATLGYTRDDVSKTEDLKRREQEMTKELSHTTIKVMEQIRKDFHALIQGEKEAIKAYERTVSIYGRFGWREIFSDILKDEREHLDKLAISLVSIEEVYNREGRIKST